jgi:hypothetical protein
MKVSGRLHTPAALPQGKNHPPTTPWTGDWMGPTAGLEAVVGRKNPIIAPAGKLTPVIQPTA